VTNDITLYASRNRFAVFFINIICFSSREYSSNCLLFGDDDGGSSLFMKTLAELND